MKQISARQVDGRMTDDYKEPTHAPGCPCPRCTGKEVPPMDRPQKWRAAAASAIPYCAECGTIIPDGRRGRPCEECEARGVIPPEGGTPARPKDGVEFAAGGTLVAAPAGESRTHLVIKSAGWMEATTVADPRFFAVCKYPERVLDRMKIERIPVGLIRCEPCRSYAIRRGLDMVGGLPERDTPLTRAVAAYRTAGGGAGGRKLAARSLIKEGAYSDDVWKRFRRLVQSA
jgi:hypothetical protein